MSNELPQEFTCLVLLAALTEDEFTKTAFGIKLKASEIARLNSETNVLSIRKKGNAQHFAASEQTYRWASEHLNTPLEGKSKAVLTVLGLIRGKTAAFLKANRISFADFMKPDPVEPAEIIKPTEAPASDVETVRQAYLMVSGGEHNARVLLKDLRKQLSMSRERQDAAFFELIKSGQADFYPEDDPMSRNEEDEGAALQIADRRRHVMYLSPEPRA